MSIARRTLLSAIPAFAAGLARPAHAAGAITVAYAGSMGVLMDKGIAPAFTAQTGIEVHGIGQASMALAHLITGKTLQADVFVPVSTAPAKAVQDAGLSGTPAPVASTSMVLAYSPVSAFAGQFAHAKGDSWTKIIVAPGLRFGRTDPATDPQGQYVLYALQLAELYYKQPGFAARVAGDAENPAQIFTEPSLLARLAAGQLDATLGYKSAVISQKLPFLPLPQEVDFSKPSLASTWYAKASLHVSSTGKTTHPSPLVFYAAALSNAANPTGAAAFIAFLQSPEGQKIFAKYGYGPTA